MDFTYRDALPDGPQRGRGAGINPGNRFETVRLHVLGEHLDEQQRAREVGDVKSTASPEHSENPDAPEVPKKIRTQVLPDQTRTLINHVDAQSSRDIPFRWTINPYRGCEHGCVYCYARPTHEYLGLSSGLDFETKILAKFDAATLLEKELAAPKWTGESIMLAGVTDIYQPVEADLKITRQILQVLARFRNPVSLITKNALVLRDIDVLSEMAQHHAAHAAVSITTLDNKLCSTLEPRASSPSARLQTIRELTAAGIPTMVMVAPIIPGLTDKEVPAILEAAAEAGAICAGYVLLRLPLQNKDLFLDWLQRTVPERAGHVESLIRQTREGGLYDSRQGIRMRGTGQIAEQISNLFKLFTKRHGLDQRWPKLSSAAFTKPQRSLFEKLPSASMRSEKLHGAKGNTVHGANKLPGNLSGEGELPGDHPGGQMSLF